VKYRLPIKKDGGVPVIAVISLGEADVGVIHDTVPQTPEEAEWLNKMEKSDANGNGNRTA
jgi:hypothetical protein